MKYVVTGAAGFIGSHLAKALVDAGHEVIGIDCFTDGYDVLLKEANAEGLDVRRLDLARDALDFSGCDGVFHLAGQPGARSFGTDFGVYLSRNAHATERVCAAATRDGVRVVLASSSSVYGAVARHPTPEDAVPAPVSPYGVSKLAAEHVAQAYAGELGLDLVVLRYFSVFGPRQRPDMAFTRIAVALARGEAFRLYGDGTQSRSWTYVADAVAAAIVAMEGGSGTYNVGGPLEASLAEAISVLEQLAGRPLDVRREAAMPGDVARVSADTTRVRGELGWAPRTSLEEGLKLQWEWAGTVAERIAPSPG